MRKSPRPTSISAAPMKRNEELDRAIESFVTASSWIRSPPPLSCVRAFSMAVASSCQKQMRHSRKRRISTRRCRARKAWPRCITRKDRCWRGTGNCLKRGSRWSDRWRCHASRPVITGDQDLVATENVDTRRATAITPNRLRPRRSRPRNCSTVERWRPTA